MQRDGHKQQIEYSQEKIPIQTLCRRGRSFLFTVSNETIEDQSTSFLSGICVCLT
jgi:hypothetical protein